MRARDVMSAPVVTVAPMTEIAEIARLLRDRRISAVPVVDPDERVVGIVSEADLMRRPEAATARHESWWLTLLAEPEERARRYVKTHGRHAADVMTRPVVTADEDATLDDIVELMERHHIKRVPVVREGKLVGIVSRADVLSGLLARRTAPEPTHGDRELRAALLKGIEDAGVEATMLTVVVTDGVAHVFGSVRTEEERRAVVVAAENVPGLQRFEGRIGIMPEMLQATLWAD